MGPRCGQGGERLQPEAAVLLPVTEVAGSPPQRQSLQAGASRSPAALRAVGTAGRARP